MSSRFIHLGWEVSSKLGGEFEIRGESEFELTSSSANQITAYYRVGIKTLSHVQSVNPLYIHLGEPHRGSELTSYVSEFIEPSVGLTVVNLTTDSPHGHRISTVILLLPLPYKYFK